MLTKSGLKTYCKSVYPPNISTSRNINDTVMNILNDIHVLLRSEPTCILFPQHVQRVKVSRAVESSIQPNKIMNDYYFDYLCMNYSWLNK